jgi:hypothetical protein
MSSDKISTRRYFRPSAVPSSTPSPHSSKAKVAVGSEIFDPDHVKSARSTVNEVKGRSPHPP